MNRETLIENYLNNKLTDFEQQRLEALLNSDSVFRDQFEFEIQVKKAFYQIEHKKNKQLLKDIENQNFSKSTNIKWYVMAASVVLILFIGYIWNQHSNSTDKLFLSYYNVAQNTTKPIIRNAGKTDKIMEAFIAYESKNYLQAQRKFEVLYDDTNQSELLFYEAICYLEIGQFQKAIKTFLKHQSYNDNLVEKSKWYLALAYLKTNRIDEVKILLIDITNAPSNYNYDKAKKLLSKL